MSDIVLHAKDTRATIRTLKLFRCFMNIDENNYYLVPDLLKATLVSGRMCALKTFKNKLTNILTQKLMVYQGHQMLILTN